MPSQWRSKGEAEKGEQEEGGVGPVGAAHVASSLWYETLFFFFFRCGNIFVKGGGRGDRNGATNSGPTTG